LDSPFLVSFPVPDFSRVGSDLAPRRSQFELDVVRVSKSHHQDTQALQVFNLTMGDPASVEFLHGPFEIFPVLHAKADMNQAYPILNEPVVTNGVASH
jgi:hypothetical protein